MYHPIKILICTINSSEIQRNFVLKTCFMKLYNISLINFFISMKIAVNRFVVELSMSFNKRCARFCV